MNKTILTAAALALTLISSVHAQDLKDLTVSGTFDYETQYVFRGKKITNSAFQPSVSFSEANVGGGSVNGYIWTSQPIGTKGGGVGPNQADEIDVGIAYDHALTGISDDTTAEIGYQLYWYPEASGTNNTVGRSHELHIGATYDTTKLLGGYNLSPSLFYYHDLILDSNTLQLGLAYSWDLSDLTQVKGLSLNPSANLGWTGIGRTFGDQATGANWANSYIYWQLNVEADYKLNTSTTFYVALHYAGNNDGSTGGFGGGNPQAPGSDSSFWGSLGVKFNM
jgi:hypothetical protein